jgi:signal transduction histidine kinase
MTHADATACRVTLRIDRSLKGRLAVVIEVNDNGVGIPADFASGIGLASMAERAEELGGTFVVATGNTSGTQIRARLPIPVLDESPPLAMEG